ncbi:MAG: hypothetical protein ACOCX2_08895 [Armatimonadota bacterium]
MTIVLLALAAVLALAVPSIREGIDTLFIEGVLGYPDKLPSPSEVERIVERHPENAQLALGSAEYLAGLRTAASRVSADYDWGAWDTYWTRLARQLPASIPAEEEVSEAYQAATALEGGFGPAHARHALWLLPSFGEMSLPLTPSGPAPRLDYRQRDALARARTALRDWASADPENATPIVMIAWTFMAEGETDAAIDELDALADAERWDSCEQETMRGIAELLSHAGHSVHMDDLFTSDTNPHAKARHVARALSDRAHERRKAGHYRPAVRSYVAALRIGIVFSQSRRAGPFISTPAVFGIASAEDDPGGPRHPTAQQIAQRRLQSLEGLARYLHRFGAGRTADRAVAALQAWQKRFDAYIAKSDAFRQWEWEAWGSPPATNARIIWWTLLALSALTGLIALSVAVLRTRDDYVPLRGRWRDWLLLAGVLILPMQIWFGLLAAPIGTPESRAPETLEELLGMEETATPVIPLRLQWAADQWLPPAMLAAGAWVLVAAGLALRRRRARPELRTGVRFVLRDVVRLAAPTLALLVVLSALAVLPANSRLHEIRNHQIERQVQGDLVYFGIVEAEEGGGETGSP